MVLCLRNTFFELEGITEAPHSTRRAASKDPSRRHHQAFADQLERLPQSPDVGKLTPRLSQASSSESGHAEPCAEVDGDVVCAPGASAAASDPCSPLLELPLRSRLLLHKLTSRGFQQMQQRMEEVAPSIGASAELSVDKVRWSDEPSDSEGEARSADTESTRADSDDAQCAGSKLRSKKAPTKAQANDRKSWKKRSDASAEAQEWSDSDWNAWMFAPAVYASWPVYQGCQWS